MQSPTDVISRYDVVVYGSSGAGIAAAVQAARDGLKTLLIEPGMRIGGMTTGGLGATDIGERMSIGGFAAEFYSKLYDYYTHPAVWKYETRDEYKPKHPFCIDDELRLHFFFEPSAALHIAGELLQECGVQIRMNDPLDRGHALIMNGQRISALALLSGEIVHADYFVDASYEGDLMAMAGVPYVIGRESNQEFGESLNGYLPGPVEETAHIDPCIIANQPDSGILPFVDPRQMLQPGEQDQRVQAYNFRFCLTDVAENRIQIEKPAGYDSLHYELLARHILARQIRCQHFPFFKTTPIPNRKTDSNNLGIISTDYIGMSHCWPEADYARRETIWQQHRDYTLGLLWFLGNDPRLPQSWRKEVCNWGLARDEFSESDNWPSQLYVREARRMRADYVICERDCMGQRIAHDPVALGSYAMDSHHVSRFVDANGKLRAEGGFWKTCKPYPVSYRAIVPPVGSCANLAVPVCLSATHAAFGSVRMEPVFMMLGQAAALAIQLARLQRCSLQEVDYESLRNSLVAQNAVLGLNRSVAHEV